MPSSNVIWELDGPIATLTFTRPHARNALTWDMYDRLLTACTDVDADEAIRVLVIRGADGAFASGTDIAQFAGFHGDDGVEYERRLDRVIDRLEAVTCMTIAAVDGAAVGGGCAIALACDLRVCSTRARFGVPVARTLGNCLSAANLARLVEAVGLPRAKDLMFSARLLDAAEAQSVGLVTRLAEPDGFDSAVRDVAADAATRARSTVRATKQLLHALAKQRRPRFEDAIIRECYASDEFREGVTAFTESRPPQWSAPRTRPSR